MQVSRTESVAVKVTVVPLDKVRADVGDLITWYKRESYRTEWHKDCDKIGEATMTISLLLFGYDL